MDWIYIYFFIYEYGNDKGFQKKIIHGYGNIQGFQKYYLWIWKYKGNSIKNLMDMEY